MTASWYVTGGALDLPTTLVTDPSVLSAATTWRLPAAPAALQLGFVLRDSRGGQRSGVRFRHPGAVPL